MFKWVRWSNNVKRRRGRPKGTIGKAAVLSPAQVKLVFQFARSRERHADRAELVFRSLGWAGSSRKELASLNWSDVYEHTGKVRQVLHLKAAYTKGGKMRDVSLSAPALRWLLSDYAAKHLGWLEQVPERPLPCGAPPPCAGTLIRGRHRAPG
jgi:site-specific recombinase XerD